ncbi:MAG: hydantoinase/oxoprolinase family protein, partial [Gaiellales bacterium]
ISELAYSEPRLAALLQSTDCIRYSTTQGTNALVQRAGPQLGLLVTDPTLVEGLGATQAQEDLLAALVGDRWGRISLDADDDALGRDLLARVNDLSARGARRLVIAVSGADGSRDEARVKGLLLRLYPRHLLGAVPLLFSWELIADPDDIRRTWSGLLNAFLHPAMERFLFNADRRLRDTRARQPLRIFRNDGASSRVSKSAALKTYSSGPRGGLEGTRALAAHYGLRHLVMLDVGGTTTDIGVVSDGAIHVERRGTIEHAPSSRTAAVFSAFGIGFSDLGQRYEEPLPAVDYATISDVADRLLALGARDMFAEGVDASACTVRFRLTVGHQDEERVIELDDLQDATTHLTPGDRASLELVLLAPLPHVTLGKRGDVGASPAEAEGMRVLRDGRRGQAETPVYALASQRPGARGSGPAVIEGPFFTMRVPEGWQFDTTAAGDLRLTDGGER